MPKDSLSQIQVLDLGSSYEADSKEEVVKTLRNSFESNGFLVVTNHGVSKDQINEVETQARKFFVQPYENKVLSKASSGVFRGYTPVEKSALSLSRDLKTPPDVCEIFSLNRFDDPVVAKNCGLKEGREAFFAPNIWPENLPGFKESLESYYAAMENLTNHLMQLSASALGLEKGWFVENHIAKSATQNYAQCCPDNKIIDMNSFDAVIGLCCKDCNISPTKQDPRDIGK